MPKGIKDKVAIIGMGCTKFGELWNKSGEDLFIDAFIEALEDAGLEAKDIQAAWTGTQYTQINVGDSALPLSVALKLPFIPVTRVENFCVTGTDSFRGACYAVASGAYDIALAVGMEKLKDVVERWGGPFEISYVKNWKDFIKEWKESFQSTGMSSITICSDLQRQFHQNGRSNTKIWA